MMIPSNRRMRWPMHASIACVSQRHSTNEPSNKKILCSSYLLLYFVVLRFTTSKTTANILICLFAVVSKIVNDIRITAIYNYTENSIRLSEFVQGKLCMKTDNRKQNKVNWNLKSDVYGFVACDWLCRWFWN